MIDLAVVDAMMTAQLFQCSFGTQRIEREEFSHLRDLTATGRNDAEEQMLSSTVFVAHCACGPQRHIEGQPRTGVQKEAIHGLNRMRQW